MICRLETDRQTQMYRITTWNVLNQRYIHEERYGAEVHPYLAWETRLPLLKATIAGLRSDIYCLQEATSELLGELLDHMGHDWRGLWAPRNHDKTDGCALLYDGTRFTFLDSQIVSTPYDRDHIVQRVYLKENTSGWSFIICNTHINWSTRALDIPAVMQSEANSGRDVILVGDFNAERSEAWYTHDLAKSGFRDVCAERSESIVNRASFSNGGKQPNKWIDYILLSGEHIQPRSCGLELHSGLEPLALPSVHVASDHLPLSLTFSIN